MKESRFEINPKHPNSNIHGVVGKDGNSICFTQKGKMCTACCTALHIEDQGVPVKKAGKNCRAQIIGKGCMHVIEGDIRNRFTVCPIYHCSGDLKKTKAGDNAAWQRLMMENGAALKNKEISRAEAKENEVLRIGNLPIPPTFKDGDLYNPDSDDADEIAQWLIDRGL